MNKQQIDKLINRLLDLEMTPDEVKILLKGQSEEMLNLTEQWIDDHPKASKDETFAGIWKILEENSEE